MQCAMRIMAMKMAMLRRRAPTFPTLILMIDFDDLESTTHGKMGVLNYTKGGLDIFLLILLMFLIFGFLRLTCLFKCFMTMIQGCWVKYMLLFWCSKFLFAAAPFVDVF